MRPGNPGGHLPGAEISIERRSWAGSRPDKLAEVPGWLFQRSAVRQRRAAFCPRRLRGSVPGSVREAARAGPAILPIQRGLRLYQYRPGV